MAALFTAGRFQAIGADGLSAPGALLYTYAAGTLTPLATFINQAGVTPNANPVVCDTAGQADVWLGSSTYRFILKTSAGVTIWDEDNISPVVGSGANATFANLTTTGNNILGDASTDTLNVGNGGLVKDSSGNVLLGLNATATDVFVIRNASTATAGFYRASDVTVSGAAGMMLSMGALNGSTQTPGASMNGVLENPPTTGYWSVSTRLAGVLTERLRVGSSGDITALGIAVARSKSATTSRASTTTLADDAHLVAAIPGTGVYAIDLFVPVWATTGGAGGFKWAIGTVGTIASSSLVATGVMNGATLAAATTIAAGTSASAATITTGTSVVTADWLRITGTVSVTGSATLSFQWAQLASNANAANVGIGGYMNCTKVA